MRAHSGPRVILIGGASHAGKSSLAKALARRLGWEALSTDRLARHPGRPWPVGDVPVPPHVVEHYSTLDADALVASVMQHYERMWPLVRDLVERRASDPDAAGLVLEGSAVLPEHAAQLLGGHVAALWLRADERLIRSRMYRESGYERADAAGRALIDAFLERARRYQRRMLDEVARLGLASLEARSGESVTQIVDRTLQLLGVAAA